jgi:flagellar biosynthesis protein FlhG
VASTHFENLGFLPGDGVTPFLANLGYFQKLKLIRCLRNLPAKYVVADLGAGSSFNTLDFFALSSRGVVVATPDTLSLLNAMTFLKHFVLRQVGQVISGDHRFKTLMDAQKHQGMRIPAGSVRELVTQIERIDNPMAEQVWQRLEELKPRLILNQADRPEDINVLSPVVKNLADKLSLEIECFGYVPFDIGVRGVVRERGVLVRDLPESVAAKGIKRIADRVIRLWDKHLERSLERLLGDAQGWTASLDASIKEEKEGVE